LPGARSRPDHETLERRAQRRRDLDRAALLAIDETWTTYETNH
jgi:hypothetical protein